MASNNWTVTTHTLDFNGVNTWVRTSHPNENDPTKAPVVVLHGGPGIGHNYLLPLQQWAEEGRQVIHYDQLGCGNSSHLPDAEPELWQPSLFIREFLNIIDTLGLKRYHIVGQSWGGMLGAEIALTRPAGLVSLSICNSPASMSSWVAEANRLRTRLPEGMDELMQSYEKAGDTANPKYLTCVDEFYRRHVCRLETSPACLEESNQQMEADPTVYHTMNGPNEFHVIGTLKDWSVIDRLDEITVPCLVLSGEYDEATPATWLPFVEHIRDVQALVVPDSSHCTHLERTDEFLTSVESFMREKEH
ncbi:proline iminopeptidase-family hydrolase [Brevibacterium aurantiacum]|uniref:Proline iminopeptidase n=1 Tax=Brevibacterium aurantiacum TaxID=273384 RepID=A0A2A3Z1X8_BREAU|nr:proline iminopeptidase-family hydrolase [Brevibacterium aurantiacum]PCC45521.1 alpha/beta hydrolase [Brevibacterium aurantiacum]